METLSTQMETFRTCQRPLACGHYCGGIPNENFCAPCMVKGCQDQNYYGDGYCIVCTEPWTSKPIIQIVCGHLFHYDCIRKMLMNRWHGSKITFGFMLCPLCKISISHPDLCEIMAPLVHLYEKIKTKALTRLQHDGLFETEDITQPCGKYYKDPVGFAMDKYAYYMCSKCKQPYFGGEGRCQDEVEEADPKELICPLCSDTTKNKVCSQHGFDYLLHKCRYCCSPALFHCFGTTHFCDTCHNNHTVVCNKPKESLPKCPAGPCGKQLSGSECPLGIEHPPTGEEFVIGCAMCMNSNSF
ncbi:E3 ubiquitin-protein ligase MYCBP2-like [Saccostrea echinata]|uniref:E3 ubiquitin-protein ligase MYCBP2-like n=1 Tax=Saccostrea echinata TaxID=191078 RepID=UPI002A7F5369|nr:E3 ubiquitin-protein ligase MYCBP2-like [Saccostrea echinata]